MKHIVWIFIAVSALFVVSCNENHEGYLLEGTIEEAEPGTLYLEYLDGQAAKTIDTAAIDDKGNFSFKGIVEDRGLHRLRLTNGTFWLLLMGNDNIELTVSADDAKTITFSKAPEATTMLQEHLLFLTDESESIGKLQQEFRRLMSSGANQSEAAALQQEINGRVVAYQESIKTRVKESDDQIIKAFLLSSLDSRQHGDFMQEQIDLIKADTEEVHVLVTRLESQLETLAKQQEIMKQQEQQRKAMLTEGSEVPNIVMKDPQGKNIKLSDLRGKVVLIDFWASWCKPCRQENPNLVKAYAKYKSKGFEIFSVSLDKNRNRWLNAIDADGLTWDYHVSDLKGWQNAAAQQYNVSGIPFAVLIDEEGKVIDTNLRGAALERKLEEVL